jgi:hypothetical protein
MLETSLTAFGTSAADRFFIMLSDGEATDGRLEGTCPIHSRKRTSASSPSAWAPRPVR